MNESVNKIGREGGAPAGATEAGPAGAEVPARVRDLTKIYGTVTAVDRISFTLAEGTTVALLGGNGAGKTTTIAMLLGLVVPSAGEVRVFGADVSRNRGTVAHRMNFQSPYVDLPARLTRGGEPHRLCRSLRHRQRRRAHRLYRRGLADRASARAPDRQALRRPEDAGRARQGAPQRARPSSARRAHRLARSRHRRLDPAQAQRLCRDPRRHASACLTQHGRGRAARRSRHPAASGAHHRGRDAGRFDRDLRTGDAGAGVSRRGPRPRQAGLRCGGAAAAPERKAS